MKCECGKMSHKQREEGLKHLNQIFRVIALPEGDSVFRYAAPEEAKTGDKFLGRFTVLAMSQQGLCVIRDNDETDTPVQFLDRLVLFSGFITHCDHCGGELEIPQ